MAYFRKDKKAPKRFHGAFHGGFSAGHFNTVGSSSGWVPQNYDSREIKDKRKSLQQQTIQDFMDDEDQETWGGVVHVQKDYQDRSSLLNAAIQKQHNSKDKNTIDFLPVEYLESTFNINDRIGIKLLKHLGWNFDTVTKEANSIVIPSPKLNLNGIDYNPYENAPEFKKAQEKIRKRAQVRARNATTGGGGSYRVSNLLEDDDDEDRGRHPFYGKNDQTSMLHTTEEDFIGTKTASGFSLKDDADDVYDDNDNDAFDSSHKFSSQYQTHVYEASDSDDYNSETNKANIEGSLDNAFKSWAENSKSNSSTTSKSLTSDGRVPIPGFQLGITDHVEQGTRWPGPDVPSDFKEGLHVFETDDDVIPQNLNFDDSEAAHYSHHHNALQSLSTINKTHSRVPVSNLDADNMNEGNSKFAEAPMAGPIFSTLAKSMKDRFVSSSLTKSDSGTEKHSQPIGLLELPVYKYTSSILENEKSEQAKVKEKHSDTKLIAHEITRTYNPWEPSKLLCKRFNIPVPKTLKINFSNSKCDVKKLDGVNSKECKSNQSITKKSSEQVYFQSTIQPLVNANKHGNSKSEQSGSMQTQLNKSNTKETISSYGYSNENSEDKISDEFPKRPPIDIFKSIFESNSESDSSSCSLAEDRKDELGSSPSHLCDKKEKQELNNIKMNQNEGYRSSATEKPIHRYIPKSNRSKANNTTRINLNNTARHKIESSIVQIGDSKKDGIGSESDAEDESSCSISQKKRHKRSTKSKRKYHQRKRKKRSNRFSSIGNDISSASEGSEDERRKRRRKKHRRRRHYDEHRRERSRRIK